MLENRDYCDYDTCVALKELGFNALVDWYFNEDKRIVSSLATYRNTYIPRISLYEAQKWLREEYNLHLEITYSPSCWTGKIYDLKEWDYIKGFTFFESFEDTFHTLIKEAIKILKK